MMRSLAIALISTAALSLAGCTQTNGKDTAYETPFISTNYAAADALLAQLRHRLPSGNLLVATLVNIDALERSSTLGRLVSEQVSARLTRAGYQVVEMKFRNSVYMLQDQGELMLTREIHELARTYAAQAVIVGTYGAGKDYVYVNLKVIQPGTNVTMAVHDYALPIDENIYALLRNKRY
ncbi:FlgO family outer membrane protein [Azotobacter salinestris]|uniref:FlgO family outer membrane protein n=1 Tax=Azotobacter salinestris TaxID=69964 RepID=UPI0032DFDAD9